MGAVVQLVGPDFLARLAVEGAETRVVGTGDERQPACRHDRPAIAGPAGVLLAFGEVIGDAQARAPDDLGLVDVHRDQLAPGRNVARRLGLGIDEAGGGHVPFAILALHQLFDIAHLVGIEDEQAQLGIEGAAAPFRAAGRAGKAHLRLVGAQRLIHFHADQIALLDDVFADRLVLGRVAGHLAEVKRHAGHHFGLEGEGLGRPGRLAGNGGGRHRAFLHAEDRLAGDAVQKEQHRRLVHHGDGGNGFAVLLDCQKHRRGVQVQVPDVVMGDLEVPQIFAGAGIHGNQRVGEQVGALVVAAIAVEGRRAERQIGNAARRIHRQQIPDIYSGNLLPAVILPGFVEFLARARNGAERPDQLAGDHIPGARIAGGALGGCFLHAAAGDGDVLVDRGWRRIAIKGVRQPVHDFGRLGVDDAVGAKTFRRRAGSGIQRDHASAQGAEDQARGMTLVARPVCQAAERRLVASGKIIGPELFAAGGIQRDHAAIRRAKEHAVADNQGRGGGKRHARQLLRRDRVHVIGPGDLKLVHIVRRDLGQRRKPPAARVIAIGRPVTALGGLRRGTERQAQGDHAQQHLLHVVPALY